MNTRLAPIGAAMLVATVLASGPAWAQADKFCVAYKADGTTMKMPVVSTAKASDCQQRSAKAGATGYGLGCDPGDGTVISTGNTANDATAAPDNQKWETEDAKQKQVCASAWKPSD